MAGLCDGLAAFQNSVRSRGGHKNGRSLIRRDAHIEEQLCVLTLPFAHDLSEHRVLPVEYPCHTTDDGRSDDDPLLILSRKVDVDASQAAMKPLLNVSQHEMVLRALGICVPGFRQSRRTSLQLIPVAWVVVARDHIEQHIRPSSVQKRSDDIVETYFPGSDVGVVVADILDKIGKYGRPLGVRN